MTRYFITLGYAGGNFWGWQKQSSGRTVQGVLEEYLSTLLRQEVTITGAGRTDTGVHARWMVCHTDLTVPAETAPGDIIYRANHYLPPDIKLYGVYEVTDEAHARFSATERRYGYYVRTKPSPFGREFCIETEKPDFQSMNRAAKALIGTHDFTAYSKKHSNVANHICTVTEAEWSTTGHGEWVFHISSNRFLRNMVRAIVGTLLAVGRGKLSEETPRLILEKKDRSLAASSAPAEGLFLEYIGYPPEIFRGVNPYDAEREDGNYRPGQMGK